MIWDKIFGTTEPAHPHDLKMASKGVELFKQGRYEEAIELFTKCIYIEADNGLHYYNRGVARVKLKQQKLAIEDFDKSVQLKPGFEKVFFWRAQAYRELGQKEKALDDWERALALKPDNAQARENKVSTLVDLYRFPEARKELDAFALDPASATAWSVRGCVHLHCKELEQALECFEKAIGIEASSGHFENRGTALILLGRHQEAVADFERILKMNGACANAYAGLATCHRKLDEPDKADALAQQAQDMSDSPKLRFELAKVYELFGNAEDLVRLLESIDGFGSLTDLQLETRYSLWFRTKNWERAMRDAGFLVERARQRGDVTQASRMLTERSAILGLMRRYGEALVEANEAIDLKLDNAEKSKVLTHRSRIFSKMRHYDDALVDANDALALAPQSTKILAHRGILFYETHKLDLAGKDCAKALELDAQSTAALNGLGLCALFTGEYQTALNYFDKLVSISTNGIYLANRAATYEALELYEKALSDIKSALAIDPNERVVWLRLASIKCEMALFNDALEAYEKGMATPRDAEENAQKLANRAFTKAMLGKFVEAEQDWNDAQKYDADLSFIFLRRGQVLVHQGERDKSFDCFKESERQISSKTTFWVKEKLKREIAKLQQGAV